MKQQNFFQNIDLIKSNESDPQVINLFSLEEIKDTTIRITLTIIRIQ